MSSLNLLLLGPPRLERDGRPVELERRKALALLAYLAVTGEQQRRDTLAALLWPDSPQGSARTALRRDLSVLNAALGEGWLAIDRETIALRRGADLWLDVLQFQQRLADCRGHGHPADQVCPACLAPLAEAAALYRADFLAGFTLPDCPDFDEWQFFQAESLRQTLAAALERLAYGHAAQAGYESAIAAARRWLALDSLHEPAHRCLMELYAEAGQQAAALRQYQLCVQTLQAELGVAPASETTALYERLRRAPAHGRRAPPGVVWVADRPAADRATPAPATRSPAGHGEMARVYLEVGTQTDQSVAINILQAGLAIPTHNLPPQPTPFVGRPEELAQLTSLLADPLCRLLTLVGPGGVGKTRLAVQAGQNIVAGLPGQPQFVHGVYFTALAAISSPDFLVSTVAAALHFASYSGADLQGQILDYLHEKEMLLVLDNFEHLLEGDLRKMGDDLLLGIMANAPRVKLLVTSRQRLNLRGEWTIEVGGMDFPAVKEENAAPLETYSAVALFLQRARQARSGFELSNQEHPAVVHICQLVEGMPLGLELAASWVRMLSCQEIAQEIERNLDFLTTPLRDVVERHQSLRAVFRHSWQLLSAAEQAVFRKLSVFRGGFTREAAEQVAGASLLLLSALVDKSLLRPSAGRYEMHELLRQYASEELQTVSGESQATQAAHADYYAALLQQREADLKGARQREALTEISAEIDNVRASWRWAITHEKLGMIARSLESLFLFSEMRGAVQEAEAAFRQAITELSRPRGTGQTLADDKACGAEAWDGDYEIVIARLLRGQGWFLTRLGAFERSQEHLQQSVASLRRAGGKATEELAISLVWLSTAAYLHEQYAAAREWARESLAISTELGNRWGVGLALMMLGHIAEEQNAYREAAALLQESIQVFKQLGERRTMSYSILILGHVARGMGAYEQARQYFEEGLTIQQDFVDLVGVGYTLRALGELAMALGRYDEARQQIAKSLALCREIGNRPALAKSLYSLGAVARLTGAFTEAAQYYEESLALCKALGNQKSIAVVLSDVGCLAYDRNMYALAEQYLRESLALCQEAAFERELASAWRYLGYIASASGPVRYPEAGQYFRQALRIALRLDAVPLSLDVLVGLAMLLATGEPQAKGSAIEWLALVQSHPASEHETKEKARRLLVQLASEESSEVMAAAQACGQARTVEEVVAEVLALEGSPPTHHG